MTEPARTPGFIAAAIYNVPVNALVALIRYPQIDPTMLNDVRREVAQRMRWKTYPSFAAAWNDVTGATPHRPGTLSYVGRMECTACHGRRINLRLGQVCAPCVGRGTITGSITITALHATERT